MQELDLRYTGEFPVMQRPTMQSRQFLACVIATPAGAFLDLPAAATTGPSIEVWKDPTCGCCKEWIGLLRNAGIDGRANQSREVIAAAIAWR